MIEIKFPDYDKSIKISSKAMAMSKKSGTLLNKHNDVISLLMLELMKYNPNVDFSDFCSDDFSYFTGENFT